MDKDECKEVQKRLDKSSTNGNDGYRDYEQQYGNNGTEMYDPYFRH